MSVAGLTPGDIEWARRVAWQAGRRMPGMDRDDAEAIGLLALVEVAKRWRKDGGAALRTLALTRIRGAVIDAQRSRWQSRRYVGGKWIVVKYLECDLAPTRALAAKSGPAAIEASTELRRALGEIRHLKPVYRDMLLRHVTGENLADVGARHGITKSWACRREQEAVAALNERLSIARSATTPRETGT